MSAYKTQAVRVKDPDSRYPLVEFFDRDGDCVGGVELDRDLGVVCLHPAAAQDHGMHVGAAEGPLLLKYRGKYLDWADIARALDVMRRVAEGQDVMTRMVAGDIVETAYRKLMESAS